MCSWSLSLQHLSPFSSFLCFFLKANVCRNFESFPTTKQEPSLLFNLTKNLEHVYKDTLFFFFFGHTFQHARSQLPNQGLNPCLMHWDHGILIPGPPRSPKTHYYYHCAQSLSRIQLFSTPQTVACQAPLPQGFSRQEYWSRLTSPPPGDLPNPGIEPRSPKLQADS